MCIVVQSDLFLLYRALKQQQVFFRKKAIKNIKRKENKIKRQFYKVVNYKKSVYPLRELNPSFRREKAMS